MKPSVKLAILALSIFLGWAGWTGLNALLRGDPAASNYGAATAVPGEHTMPKKINKSDTDWKQALTPEQYNVMRKRGTERAFTGKYDNFYEPGTYVCAGCGTPLFSSRTKYDHGTGWPSFTEAVEPANVEFLDDHSFFMHRVEVRCAACGAHLGHVFDDGPAPTGKHYCINSVSLDFTPGDPASDQPASKPEKGSGKTKTAPLPKTEVATFAAGCFWGVEYKFGQVKGVLGTTVGYTGGLTANPTYEDVCSNTTGHAEAVRVTFDPSVVAYEDLVREFFGFHDPTQLNRQGPDHGRQYRSAIFYHNEEQREIAERVKTELNQSGAFKKPIVTEIVSAPRFFKAEEYHQKYYQKNKLKSCAF